MILLFPEGALPDSEGASAPLLQATKEKVQMKARNRVNNRFIALLEFLTINRNTAVGANDRTARATRTIVGLSHFGIIVAATVYLGSQTQHIERTRCNTDLTALATLAIDDDCSFNFSHSSL